MSDNPSITESLQDLVPVTKFLFRLDKLRAARPELFPEKHAYSRYFQLLFDHRDASDEQLIAILTAQVLTASQRAGYIVIDNGTPVLAISPPKDEFVDCVFHVREK